MKLSEIKTLLETLDHVEFRLENGNFVPSHFHVTEVGLVSKHFIDCGGTIRDEVVVSFQLWDAHDVEHRLKPSKLLRIIALSEEKLGIGDHEIEVEYQGDTIGKYALDFDGKDFVLISKQTACLAADTCGTGIQKTKVRLSDLATKNSCCTTDNTCCTS